MKTKDLTGNIDFADAEFNSLKLEDNNLIVFLESWNGKTIKISFYEIVQFSYKLESTISLFVECLEKTVFLEESLRLNYDKIPEEYPHKEFWMVDIDDIVFITHLTHF